MVTRTVHSGKCDCAEREREREREKDAISWVQLS